MKLISEDVQDIEVEKIGDELLLIQGGDRIVLSRQQLAQLVAAQQPRALDEGYACNCPAQHAHMTYVAHDVTCPARLRQ